MGVGGQRHAPAAFTPGKDAVPAVYETGWATGPVWTGEENLAPTGIRSPDRPARSEWLYRLSYPEVLGEKAGPVLHYSPQTPRDWSFVIEKEILDKSVRSNDESSERMLTGVIFFLNNNVHKTQCFVSDTDWRKDHNRKDETCGICATLYIKKRKRNLSAAPSPIVL